MLIMKIGSHFKGKKVFEHLREARKKGLMATQESHGIETRGHIVGGADGARETVTTTLLIWTLGVALKLEEQQIFILIALFMWGFLLWKVGRSAVLAWSRIERVNKLIEEEKYEIEHNRDEEKAELREMYETKGFSGELLDTVIDVLMADDNKLLGVMLEEELGVSLETFDHPLKQALGAGIGVLLASGILLLGMYLFGAIGLYSAGFAVIVLASYFIALIEKIDSLHYVVWNLAIAFLAVFGTLFLTQFILLEKL